MTSIEGYVLLQGEHFSPSQTEKLTGVIFHEKNEPGDIGIRGKYKGRPIPHGSASINFRDEGTDSPDLLSSHLPLLHILDRCVTSFRAAGAVEITLYVHVYYSKQCNLFLSPELLKRLASFGIPLGISAIEEGDEE